MSQPHDPTQPKWQVPEVQERVAQQLRELEQALLRMRSGADTTSKIQLKMRDR